MFASISGVWIIDEICTCNKHKGFTLSELGTYN